MPFKVKATVIGFVGDNDKFPCHFKHEIGDEFIWDGEKTIGRICPDVIINFLELAQNIRIGGKKWRPPAPLFTYAGNSVRDPSMEKYDGMGWRPTKEDAFGLKWTNGVPYPVEPELPRGRIIICPDRRTGVQFKLEPAGLCENGYDTHYYRREMSIFKKIKAKPGIEVDKILDEFTKWERWDIYPPLTPPMLEQMLDELAQADYIEIREGRTYPIKK